MQGQVRVCVPAYAQTPLSTDLTMVAVSYILNFYLFYKNKCIDRELWEMLCLLEVREDSEQEL